MHIWVTRTQLRWWQHQEYHENYSGEHPSRRGIFLCGVGVFAQARLGGVLIQESWANRVAVLGLLKKKTKVIPDTREVRRD